MAETHRFDLCITLHITGQNGHGIGIVEEKCIRADLFHISCKSFQYRDRPKSSHDPANSQRICDGLLQTVFLRDLKICHGTGLITTHLDRIYNKCCIPQSIFSVFHPKIGLDDGSSLVYVLIDGGKNDPGILQALLVDVIKCDLAVLQGRSAHTVSQYISCKNRASSSHKSDFHCDSSFFLCFF